MEKKPGTWAFALRAAREAEWVLSLGNMLGGAKWLATGVSALCGLGAVVGGIVNGWPAPNILVSALLAVILGFFLVGVARAAFLPSGGGGGPVGGADPSGAEETQSLRERIREAERERDEAARRAKEAHTKAALATERLELERRRFDSAAAQSEADCEEARRNNQVLREEAQELRAAIENRDTSLREMWWTNRYGLSYPYIADIPLQKVEPARLRAQEIRPAAQAAYEHCASLLQGLLTEMKGAGEETCSWFLAGFVSERVGTRLDYAWESLVKVLADPGTDVRQPLLGFLYRYDSAKAWLVRALSLIGWPADAKAPYQRWAEAHNSFVVELGRLLAREEFAAVGEGAPRATDRAEPWLLRPSHSDIEAPTRSTSES